VTQKSNFIYIDDFVCIKVDDIDDDDNDGVDIDESQGKSGTRPTQAAYVLEAELIVWHATLIYHFIM
jgi:hypothetical protein